VRELAAQDGIGSVNHRHLSFMGSITAPGRLVRDPAPAAARLLVQDQVDVALLVPV
jgi:D-proline reductase (dithiol) PrdB